MAHGNERIGKVIPTPETLSELEGAIKVFRSFGGDLNRFFKPVREFTPDHAIISILSEMHTYGFSQIALRRDGKLDVLTAIDITEWLASQASLGLVSIEDATVRDVLAERPSAHFVVRPRNTTVATAAQEFSKAAAAGSISNLFCILITHSGKDTETPLGIITAWDIMLVS